jgi:DnaK suppressor protein
MKKQTNNSPSRFEALRELLNRQRNIELARIKDFRRDQSEAKLTVPSDELEAARSEADVELQASLIERSENRLKAIDAAFSRLEQGSYGTCDQCGNEISLERLKALPFAIYCVDCQEEREQGRAAGKIEPPFTSRWTPPEEISHATEDADTVVDAEDDLVIRNSAFGPEEGELEAQELRQPVRRRGRPRKNAA